MTYTLVLLRHGESEWNAKNLFTGWVDVDLTEKGRAEAITVPANGLVNLAEPPADIVLTGDFTAGNFVPLSVDFGNGERISLNVPVVADDSGYWEGMDAS